MFPLAVASRLAAARLSPIDPVAVALTASAVTRPAPEMLPPVALSVTSPAAVSASETAIWPAVSVAFVPTPTAPPTSSVASPAVVAESDPLIVDAARFRPLSATSVTLLPLTTLTGPL